jgi:RNA polymerase sigma-70 factor (ECF subfamily)
MKDLTDEEIAFALQNGDKQIFSLIVERYEDKIFRYGRRYFSEKEDIEEMVQDVFLKVYINIQSFDTNKKFSSWIYRIAHNRFVNKIAWKSIRYIISLDTDEFLPNSISSLENTEKESIQREEKDLMEKYLNELNEKYKTPIILFFYQDLSYDEIADVLKIPISTVGIRIKRGKDNLKKIIEKYETR